MVIIRTGSSKNTATPTTETSVPIAISPATTRYPAATRTITSTAAIPSDPIPATRPDRSAVTMPASAAPCEAARYCSDAQRSPPPALRTRRPVMMSVARLLASPIAACCAVLWREIARLGSATSTRLSGTPTSTISPTIRSVHSRYTEIPTMLITADPPSATCRKISAATSASAEHTDSTPPELAPSIARRRASGTRVASTRRSWASSFSARLLIRAPKR